MKQWFIFAVVLLLRIFPVSAQETEIHYLSGTGNDNTIDWAFFCTDGRNSGQWSTIPVPSQWELQGFGTYNYGHDRPKADEQGKYRYDFEVPAAWQGKNATLVFEGVMTDTEVWINGKSAGAMHQGGFYEFSYDVSELLKYGDTNRLEATVYKVSHDASVEAAERQGDYWVFGGIFRPVYLKISPAEFINRTAIDARADGTFTIDCFLQGISAVDRMTAQIYTPDGRALGEPMTASLPAGRKQIRLLTTVANPETWTAETPNLYSVAVTLWHGNELVHRIAENFGFRTVEIRPGDGIYINNRKILLKGVNRHSFWPESGRTTSRDLSITDVMLMKDMNMNAVRMSHYPPDRHFLDACDSLGLYVLDELAGWQRPPYDTGIGKKLVEELVVRDVNHPSIIFWDNGNEGGNNWDLDGEFGTWDPQNRPVLHPWARHGGLETDHYESWDVVNRYLAEHVYLPTEFLHGMYDGGHGAGLKDHWDLMRTSLVFCM